MENALRHRHIELFGRFLKGFRAGILVTGLEYLFEFLREGLDFAPHSFVAKPPLLVCLYALFLRFDICHRRAKFSIGLLRSSA